MKTEIRLQKGMKIQLALVLVSCWLVRNCVGVSQCYLVSPDRHNVLHLVALQVDTAWDPSSSSILDVISPVTEYKECQDFCRGSAGCEGWTLRLEECTLLGELGERVEEEGSVSGPPSCQGVIISGGAPASSVGSSVELFIPFSGGHCQLPSLHQPRVAHSMEASQGSVLVCGGYDQWRSCVRLSGRISL